MDREREEAEDTDCSAKVESVGEGMKIADDLEENIGWNGVDRWLDAAGYCRVPGMEG